jgi:hypothetical protein
LVRWYTWDPLPETDQLLYAVARRDFGQVAAPKFIRAWKMLSRAILDFPFSPGTARAGPMPKGPAHPLFADAAYHPRHSRGRQFVNDLNWVQPWGVEITTKYFSLMERQWSEGVRLMEQGVSEVPATKRLEALRELGVADTFLCHLRSVRAVLEYHQYRCQLGVASNERSAREFLNRMASVAGAERINAERALRWVEADSRLGYCNGGVGITIGATRGGIYSAASIRKKIAQLDRLLSTLASKDSRGRHGGAEALESPAARREARTGGNGGFQ